MAEVVPLIGAGAAKSTGRLAGWWSSANAVLNKTTGAKTSTAQDRYFLMNHSLTKEITNWKSHSIQQVIVQSGSGASVAGQQAAKTDKH
jgi:hypothetical protein